MTTHAKRIQLDDGGAPATAESAPAETSAAPFTAPAIVGVQGFSADEQPLVSGIAGLPREVVRARSTVPIAHRHIGSSAVVVFEDGDPYRPIILGILEPGNAAASARLAVTAEVKVDDQRLVVSAEREIVLRCGESSITLTRAGKVIIAGTYIVSRSTGYNKIKGAAVDIN